MKAHYILVLDTDDGRKTFEKTQNNPEFVPHTGDSIQVAGEQLRVATFYTFESVYVSAYLYLINTRLDVTAFIAGLHAEGWTEKK